MSIEYISNSSCKTISLQWLIECYKFCQTQVYWGKENEFHWKFNSMIVSLGLRYKYTEVHMGNQCSSPEKPDKLNV